MKNVKRTDEHKKHAYKTGLMIGGNENSKIRKDLPRYKLKSTNFNQKIIVI